VIVVSACLAGVRCRYDGGARLDDKVLALSKVEEFLPLCPEQLGGLPTPRPTAEIVGGGGDDVLSGKAKVVDMEGRDVTAQFLRGAREALMIALEAGAKRAVLKEKSPSCGVRRVYRDGVLVTGEGVLTALFMREGVEVISDEELQV